MERSRTWARICLIWLGLCGPVAITPAAAQAACKTYTSAQSWSQTRTMLGDSAAEVCTLMVNSSYPADYGDKRIFATPAGVVPVPGQTGLYQCRADRTGVRLGGQYDGYPLPEETMTIDEGRIAAQHCIDVTGAGSTKALTAGPTPPTTVTVRGTSPRRKVARLLGTRSTQMASHADGLSSQPP